MFGGNVRRVLAGAAAAAVVVLSGAACSGQDADTKEAKKGAAVPYDELRALAFRDGEVPNVHDTPVQEPSPRMSEPTAPPVSNASCGTVLAAVNGAGAPTVVRQVFNWKDDLWGGSSTLASYDGDGARQAFARLRSSLTTCASYDGVTAEGPYTTELTATAAPRVGDEALAFRTATPTKDGLVLHREHVVVRTGGITATFTKVEAVGDARFPRQLIRRQVERLEEAQGR
ncbi:hypothetical protein [Streptomyces sp. NPDC003247]|uniref:hypothetical protein n=1 Tax=Streptomyces sp. NPDC003247 TaxID=3364677 RepID=UPI0036AD6D2C